LVSLAQADESANELTEAMLHYCDHLAEEKQHGDFRRRYVERFSVERVVQTHAEAIELAIGG
jgi:hypothetical protein